MVVVHLELDIDVFVLLCLGVVLTIAGEGGCPLRGAGAEA